MNIEKQIEKFFVSHTKLDTYKTCPKQYYYKYIQRLDKKITRRAFYFGEDMHKLIELFLLTRSEEIKESRRLALEEHMSKKEELLLPFGDTEGNEAEKLEKWTKKAEELWGDTLTWRDYIREVIYPRYENLGDSVKAELGFNYVNDLIVLMGQYEYFYSGDNIKVLSLEHKKRSPMGNVNGKDVFLTYICDAIIDINGSQYLMEHKTFSSSPMSYDETWLNVQTAEYVSALNKEGWNIKGVLWDNVKSKAPEELNILKSGKYGKQSQGRSIFSMITPETIMQGLDAVIEAVRENTPLAVELEIDNNHNFFLARHSTTFNDEAVKAIRNDSDTVIEVITREEVPFYRNIGRQSCNFCPFQDICSMEMLGHDTTDIINTLYNKGETK